MPGVPSANHLFLNENAFANHPALCLIFFSIGLVHRLRSGRLVRKQTGGYDPKRLRYDK